MRGSGSWLLLIAISFALLSAASARASVPSIRLEADDGRVIWNVMGTVYEDAERASDAVRRYLEVGYDGYFFLFCDSSVSVGQLQEALDLLYQIGVRRVLFHRIRGTLVEPGEEVIRSTRERGDRV